MTDTPLLEIKGLTKQFPGVLALDSVDLTIGHGEIHVLLGENGAGKSTLIKSIMGIEKPNQGEFKWNGEPIQINNIAEAYEKGISVIYQELSNIQCLSVVENMFVGNEITKGKFLIDWKLQKKTARKFLDKVGCNVHEDTICEQLGMGQKQLVEIAKSLMRNSKLVIMDEPTSSLSRKEIDSLLVLMENLKKSGVSILFITHKLDEAERVGDVVTILKDGKKVGKTLPMSEVNEEKIIKLMVGRELNEKYPLRNKKIGEKVLQVKDLSGGKYNDISFDLHKGELLGIFGLVGAGRTEMVRGLFGADPITGGMITLNNKKIEINKTKEAIDAGIVLVTENRKEEGLVLFHDVVENCTLPTLDNFKNNFLLSHKKRIAETSKHANKMNLRPFQIDKHAMNFSGGNQQKLVIEKWILSDAEIYIFDEPTKGVDIGAKTEIYSIMNGLLEDGKSIIMVSSEMQEVLGMSDRIMVMYEGRKTGIISNDKNATHENLMILGTGGELQWQQK